MEALKKSMYSNEVLGKYDLKHNQFSNEGSIEKICDYLAEARHVSQITMSEFISETEMNMLTEALAANKPAKGKKGKKKK